MTDNLSMTVARDHAKSTRTNKASEPIRECDPVSCSSSTRFGFRYEASESCGLGTYPLGDRTRLQGGVRPKVKSGSNAQLKSQGPNRRAEGGLHATQRKMSEGAKKMGSACARKRFTPRTNTELKEGFSFLFSLPPLVVVSRRLKNWSARQWQ